MPADRQAIKARLEAPSDDRAASGRRLKPLGDWYKRDCHVLRDVTDGVSIWRGLMLAIVSEKPNGLIDLITHAPTDLAALLADVEAAEAQNLQWQSQCDALAQLASEERARAEAAEAEVRRLRDALAQHMCPPYGQACPVCAALATPEGEGR